MLNLSLSGQDPDQTLAALQRCVTVSTGATPLHDRGVSTSKSGFWRRWVDKAALKKIDLPLKAETLSWHFKAWNRPWITNVWCAWQRAATWEPLLS